MNFKFKFTFLTLALAAFFIISCTGEKSQPSTPKPTEKIDLKIPDEAFLKIGEDASNIVEMSKINQSVWIHTTYSNYNGSLVPSNGLVVLTDNGLVLVDTPWTDKQMESLDKLCRESFNIGIGKAIVTHAHADRIGGAGYLRKAGVSVTSLKRVADKAAELGFVVPDDVIEGDEALVEVDDTQFEIYFPGEGHTSDNTVVWIKKYDLLFAGCIVKEQGVTSLGNISEANLDEWPKSLNKLVERYESVAIVVPGHGQWGDKSLIDYTLGLFEE